VTAVVAVDAQEPMSEDTALEIAAHLALDEASDGSPRRSGACEEGLDLFAHHLMKKGLLGLVSFVANRDGFAGTGIALRLLSKRCAAWGGGDGHDSPCPLCISPLV